MSIIDSILSFCEALSSDDHISMENFHRAAAEYASANDIARLTIHSSLREGAFASGRPNIHGISADLGRPPQTAHAPLSEREYKEIVLYDNPDITEYNEPIVRRFSVEAKDDVIAYTYPAKGTTYTDEQLKLIDVIQDISFYYFGRLRLGEVVKKSALTQYQTGLPNSGGYMVRVAEFYEKGLLTGYDAYSINVKGFGLISKKFGFRQGDDMIRQYAHYISGFAGDDEIVAHLGGDNFVALIKKSRYAAFVGMLSGVPVTAYKGEEPREISLESRIGVWHIDKELKDISEVIALPSLAVNAAKNILHQTICHVSDELLFQISEQKRVLELFPSAMRNQEFLVYYQPKVDSRDHTLAGAEALVRWTRKGEMVPPGAFVPVLEREGAIRDLDLYVLEHACMDIRRWENLGLKPVQISVNISRKDLDDRALPYHICEIIDRYEVKHEYIQIEVTETTDETEHDVMIDFLCKLGDMGISTAIDDFGSGYSSLSTLRNFKINTLKIDRSFIDNDTFSKNDEIILSDIIHMATMLGVEVITEGVERPDQLEFMNKVGCFLIQGFLYDRPLPVDEFIDRLNNRKYNAAWQS